MNLPWPTHERDPAVFAAAGSERTHESDHVNELAEDRKAAAINNSYHHLLMAAPYRAGIRSAHFIDGCALSGLHSLRSSQPDFRDFGDRYPVIPGSREIFQPDFESKFPAWRQRLLMGFEYLLRVLLDRLPIEIGENHLHFDHPNRLVRDVLHCGLDHSNLVAHKVFAGRDAGVRKLNAALNARCVRHYFRQRGSG